MAASAPEPSEWAGGETSQPVVDERHQLRDDPLGFHFLVTDDGRLLPADHEVARSLEPRLWGAVASPLPSGVASGRPRAEGIDPSL